jgi:cytochrome P450 family 150 subfamily A5
MQPAHPDELDFFGLDDATIADPHQYFSAIGARGGVYQEPHHGVFVVTRAGFIREIARDVTRFSSLNSQTGPDTEYPGTFHGPDISAQVQAFRRKMRLPPLLMSDPPAHTMERSLVAKLFTPTRVDRMRPLMRELANDLIDDWIELGAVDFVDRFARPFPFAVITTMLGIPEEDRAEFEERTRHERPDGPEDRETTLFVLDRFMAYLESRRHDERDDHLGLLAGARYDDGSLPSVFHLSEVAGLVFLAARETTTALLCSGVQILAADPQLMTTLRRDRSQVPRFVDELLRFEPPVKGLFRLALVDVELAGVTFPAGSTVMLAWAGGNRDPREVADPDAFRLDRAAGEPLLSFGAGPHYCIGARLSRTEAVVAFDALVTRLEGISLDGPIEPHRIRSHGLRGVHCLPVCFTKVPSGALPAR